MAETIRGKATNGTFVKSTKPTTVYYTAAKTWQYVGGTTNYAFTHTSLPAGLAGRQVVSATLEIEPSQAAGTRTLKVQRHAKPGKSYAALTWNNRPGVLAGSTEVSITQSALTKVWSFNVTADIQAVAAGGLFYGWRISSTHPSAWGLYSWAGPRAARLVVVLADVLDAPSGLAPHGVVSINNPKFTWLSAPSLSAAQLQVDELDGDFTTPLWDSGTVATTVAQLDPVALGWAGLAANDSVSVRVRETLDAGVTPWSDPVDVTRTLKGTLAITNPSGGTTGDPTPPVIHTFTGTQTSFQLLTYANGVLVDDSKRIAGTDLTWTPAKGATAGGQTLTLVVRAWDDVARTASANDPEYVEASATVVYTPSEATEAVSALSATQVGVRPWVDLGWTRDEVADEWLVLRDGVIIDRIDGTDDDGAVWSYRDWTCPPNTDVIYHVQPVVNNVAGQTGPATPIRTEVTGAWIIDPGTEAHFTFSGADTQLTYGENSVWHETIGGSYAFKTTFALRGLEGTVKGQMDAYDDRTLAEQTADTFAIKQATTGTYRYVSGDVNIPVTISNLSPVFDSAATMVHRVIKAVELTLRQNGELPFDPISL